MARFAFLLVLFVATVARADFPPPMPPGENATPAEQRSYEERYRRWEDRMFPTTPPEPAPEPAPEGEVDGSVGFALGAISGLGLLIMITQTARLLRARRMLR